MLLPLCSLLALAPTPPQASPGHLVPTRNDTLVMREDDQGHRAVAVVGHEFAAPVALAGTAAPEWGSLGPFGGDVEDVSASPTANGVVLAGLAPALGAGGLYRSTDGGSSWSEVGALSGTSVYDIEFTAGGTVYIGTIDGVWRSTDDGASWTNLPLGIGLNDQVFEVTLDPGLPQRIWVGVADALGNQPVNVLLSSDGGATWSDRTPPLAAPQTCTGIAVSSANPARVVLTFGGAFGGGAVWASTNGGSTWTDRSAGLPNNPMNDAYIDAQRLLVCGGQAFGSQFVGLYRSTDLGASWTAVHDASWPSLVIRDIEVDPAFPARVFLASDGAGVFRSLQSEMFWTFGLGGTAGLSLNEVSFDSQNTGRIFLGASSAAVLRSTNAGASFVTSSTGISALDEYSVDGNPVNPYEVAVAFQGLNNGGVYATTNGGVNWQLQSLPGTRYNAVRFAPDGTLYALSDGPTTIAPEGVYRRSGAWTSLGPDQGGLFETELFSLRFSVNDPDLILAGGGDFGVAGFEGTVWRSADRGATWTKAYEGSDDFDRIRDIEWVEDGTDTVALGSFTHTSGNQEGGVVRTTDGGASWTESSAGLPVGVQAESIASSPTSPTRFFLADNDFPATAGGLYETTDGGLTWSNTGYTRRLLRIEASPSDPDVLYGAGFEAPKLRVSTDGGATFGAFDSGASGIGNVRDLSLSRSGEDLFAAGTTGTWRTRVGDLIGTRYCSPGVPNSTGASSVVSARGSLDVQTNDVRLTVERLPRFSFGYFLTSQTQASVPNAGGSQGTLCLGGSIGRFIGQVQNSGAAGAFSITANLAALPQPNGFVSATAGQTWSFQAWHRDANPSVTSNFSDGVALTLQ